MTRIFNGIFAQFQGLTVKLTKSVFRFSLHNGNFWEEKVEGFFYIQGIDRS